MGDILHFIFKIIIRIRSLEAFKNPWILPVAIMVIVVAFVSVFIDKDFKSMSSFGGLLRILLKLSP